MSATDYAVLFLITVYGIEKVKLYQEIKEVEEQITQELFEQTDDDDFIF